MIALALRFISAAHVISERTYTRSPSFEKLACSHPVHPSLATAWRAPLASTAVRSTTLPSVIVMKSTVDPPVGTTHSCGGVTPPSIAACCGAQHPTHGCQRRSPPCCADAAGASTQDSTAAIAVERSARVVMVMFVSSEPEVKTDTRRDPREVDPIESGVIPAECSTRRGVAHVCRNRVARTQ